MASPQKYNGCLLYPIHNDETGQVDYWEVHEPCPENHWVTRPGSPTEKAEWLDCCHQQSEPDGMAKTLAEARRLAIGIAYKFHSFRSLDRLMRGD